MTVTLLVITLLAAGFISGLCIGATILRDWLEERRMHKATLPRVKTVNSTALYLAWSNPQKTRRKW